jgi:signal transduction histidine kinase
VVQLFRCVQEIMANVMKHAQAKRVRVQTGHDAQGVWLRIADDGVGLGSGQRQGGRGLDNLRDRARAIGASLELGPDPLTGAGTAVTLRFLNVP